VRPLRKALEAGPFSSRGRLGDPLGERLREQSCGNQLTLRVVPLANRLRYRLPVSAMPAAVPAAVPTGSKRESGRRWARVSAVARRDRSARTLRVMLERASARMLPLTNRAADYAPMAPACCNVCRTCTTTNVVGLVFVGAAALSGLVGRVTRRVLKRP
jgi:hypothetical protein